MNKTKFTKAFQIGMHGGESIRLSAPSWDCGWYWGFGYLGNRNCHYHVDGLKKVRTYNHEKKVFEYTFHDLHSGFKAHFGNTLRITDSDLWVVAELFETFYALKKTAEVLGRGGAHMTTNPIALTILNEDEAKRINEVVMPALFDAMHDALKAYGPKKAVYLEIAESVNQWADITSDKTVNLMFDKNVKWDDFDFFNQKFKKVSDNDRSVLHSKFYERYHAERKAKKASK